jgi:hypothetical protein
LIILLLLVAVREVHFKAVLAAAVVVLVDINQEQDIQ